MRSDFLKGIIAIWLGAAAIIAAAAYGPAFLDKLIVALR